MATAVVPRVFKNYINGEWVESVSARAFENRNPANTDELVGLFPASTAEDVDAAVDAAREAYESWRLVPAPKRAEILYRAAETLVKRKEDLARDMTREMGKVIGETRGDVQEAIDMTYYMAGEGRRQFGQTTPSELRNKFAMSVRQPLGVCAMITPWNFPMAIPSWKMMPALVCGNTLVIKPAEDTPLSTYNLAQILTEAGVPRGVVNVVNGTGPEVGAPLASHPGVAAVSFTGSSEVGRLVSEICAPKLRPCHLEMGGKNILIVMEDANLDLAVEGAVWAGFGTTGQRCTAASRVAVHKKVYNEFQSRNSSSASRRCKVGDGLDPATEMGPCINEEQLHKVMEYVEIGKNEGAKLAAGGHRLDGRRSWRTDGSTSRPFSATAIRRCASRRKKSSGRWWRCCRSTASSRPSRSPTAWRYGLSASIYTRDVNRAFQAMRDLHTGIVYVNAPTIGAEIHLPFGGTKQTGNGHREAGTAALDFYSEWKTLYVDYSNRLQRAQIDS